MKKQIKKADLKAFLTQTERMLLDNGFKRTIVSDKVNYEWIKITNFGVLLINPDNEAIFCFSIFGRFVNPERANYVLLRFGGNTYSGKCNIHTSELSEALRQLNELIMVAG